MKTQMSRTLIGSRQKLRAAGLLVAGGAWGDASSRAYYAAFHAVSAVLLSRGQTYSRHGQVLGTFNRAFVHTGLLPKEFTALLTRLFENRQSGDYGILPGVTETEARQDIADAQRIVEAMRRFLSPPPGSGA